MKHQKPTPPAPTTPNHWRTLTQQSAPAAATPISQKRQKRTMLKKIAIILALIAVAVIAFEVYAAWQKNPTSVKAPIKDKPLKHITITNPNGVLDQAWAERTLSIPPGADMMELDITALRNRLLSTPQVRAANLTRQFPDTLAITLEERTPVARIHIQQTDGQREDLLVATDGAIYSGANYAPAAVATLPYLAHVNLLRTTPGAHEYLPLQGMDDIAQLVSDAKLKTPALYATWHSISLKRYEEDRLLIVNTNRAAEIIFSIGPRGGDFVNQLARLDYILDTLARTAPPDRGPVRTIDLSVGETPSGIQVPVTFYPAPTTSATTATNRQPRQR